MEEKKKKALKYKQIYVLSIIKKKKSHLNFCQYVIEPISHYLEKLVSCVCFF